jgi:lauroyl/myristoyl acyltransferase
MDLENQRQQIRERVYNPTEFDLVRESYHFSLFSANLMKFLPHLRREDYRSLYQDKYYFQYTSSVELDSLEYLQRSKIINHSSFDFVNPNKEINYVFAAFHLGSYRTIITYLYEQGLKIALIIDDSVFVEQMDAIKNTFAKYILGKESSDLIILNVSDRTSIFQLKQLVEKGYVMGVYLDGNTSLNAKAQDFSKGYIPISFFDQEIYVKNGVGKLAAILNAKIITSISHRDENEENTIEFFEEISMDDFADKQEFSVKAIEKCYSYLEKLVVKYPMQWECWSYIHNWFPRNIQIPYDSIPEKVSKFNTERYDLYEVNEKHFIFDLQSYQSYPIPAKVKKALEENKIKRINKDFLLALKSKNIVV